MNIVAFILTRRNMALKLLRSKENWNSVLLQWPEMIKTWYYRGRLANCAGLQSVDISVYKKFSSKNALSKPICRKIQYSSLVFILVLSRNTVLWDIKFGCQSIM